MYDNEAALLYDIHVFVGVRKIDNMLHEWKVVYSC